MGLMPLSSRSVFRHVCQPLGGNLLLEEGKPLLQRGLRVGKMLQRSKIAAAMRAD